MADYDKLIDTETWAFIRETEKWYPPETYEKDITEQRRIYDAMCRAFSTGYPDKVRAQDLDAQGVPFRAYQRTNARRGVTVLYGHGGSLMLGGLDSHDDVCAEICDVTGHDVIAVDYRLCPEFTRQDALDDCQTVLDWIRQDRGGKVICVGDSAGGFLAAGIVQANRNVGDIIGQVLIYPGLSLALEGGSIDEHAFAPLLTRAEIQVYRESLKVETPSDQKGQCQPLRDDFSGLPVTITMSAECDPIADHSRIYATAINDAGGRAFWFEDKGLVHGHLRARHTVKRARASFDRALRAISLIGSGEPFGRADIEN